MQKAVSADFTIQETSGSDLEEILAIEKKSFADPWSRRLFEETLAYPHSVNFVLRGPDKAVLGYINFYIIAEEAHMLNLAVHPDWRKKGLATRLLAYSLEHLRHRNAPDVFLEVREGNRDAIQLYSRFGFQAIGKRKKYYVETNEDALVMHLVHGSVQCG